MSHDLVPTCKGNVHKFQRKRIRNHPARSYLYHLSPLTLRKLNITESTISDTVNLNSPVDSKTTHFKPTRNRLLHANNELLDRRHPQANVVCLRATSEKVDMYRQCSISVMRLHGCQATLESGLPKRIDRKHVPLAKTSNWSTTGLDNVSQFKASNRELIRRSRSSAIRLCWGYGRLSQKNFNHRRQSRTCVVCFIRVSCSLMILKMGNADSGI